MHKSHPSRFQWGWMMGTAAALLASPAFGQNADEFADVYDLSASDAPAATGLFDVSDGEDEDTAVNMDSFGKVDLAVKDLEIAKVLQLLSIQSQKNIVTSRNVSGTVSADLYGVTFHEALDAILEPNGFGYEEKGNFIYVYTADELQQRRDAARELKTRIIQLNYLNGSDAKTIAEAMMSDSGSVTFSSEAEDGFMPSDSDAGGNSFALPDAVIVRDFEENVAAVEALLAELDVRPKQVLIEATILQASLEEDNAFGVDFSVFSNLNAFDFTNPLNAVGELISTAVTNNDSGGAITSGVGNTAAPGGAKVGIIGSDAAVFVRALDSVTDTTVIAKPNILVLNRQRADLLVGGRLGYLSTTVTDTSNTQTIEFLDEGTQLTVRPFISNEGTIRLELRPAISDATTAVQAGFVIPNETTQELITNIIVEDGQTVVIGGLFKEDITNNRDQVPGLGDVPLIGGAFQGKEDSVDRSEVIFLIKTTIVEPSAMALGGEAAQEAIRNKRIGAKQGLLPWSTDKLVSSNLLSAQKALRDGDTNKALWHTNLALHISPVSADALALKQQITGEQIGYQDRSQLKGIMDAMIERDVEAMTPAEPAETETVESVEATDQAPVWTEDQTDAQADVEITDAAEAEVLIDTAEALEQDQAEVKAGVQVENAPVELVESFETTEVSEVDAPAADESVESSVEALPAQAGQAQEVEEVQDGQADAAAFEADIDEAAADDAGLVEVIADDEWAFDFSEAESQEPPTNAESSADAQVGEFDASFFEPTGGEVPDFATELSQSEPVDVATPAEASETDEQDPVFNYYEQLMSEVQTAE